MAEVYVGFKTEAFKHQLEIILGKKLKQGLSKDFKFWATNEYALAIAKYVPYGKSKKNHRGGRLLRSAKVVPYGRDFAIRYSAKSPKGYDYAKYQYMPEEYGQNEAEWNRYTPNTYSHWNRHLSRLERQRFLDDCANEFVRRANKRR